MTRTRARYFDGRAFRILDWSPADQIVRCRQMDGAFAPIHPIPPVDFRRHQAPLADLGQDPRRLVLELRILAACRPGKGWPTLCPMCQVARRRDTYRVGLAIPLRISKNVGSIFGFDNARIFNPAWPLPRLLRIFSRV